MNEYQREQLDALRIVRQGLAQLSETQRRQLEREIEPYNRFRASVDIFLDRYFKDVCTRLCYRSRTSACCSKDGIITFFADTVINALQSTSGQLDRMEAGLQQVNNGHRCIYLNDDGCVWTVRPVVCAMFLCDRAQETIFAENPEAGQAWKTLRRQEKVFKWPVRPVLFDRLEKVFLDRGYRSTLMHLNFSPGLLMVKKRAGIFE